MEVNYLKVFPLMFLTFGKLKHGKLKLRVKLSVDEAAP
jgi:hypothetical protein